MIDNCCLYLPVEKIPLKKILKNVRSNGGWFRRATSYEFDCEEGTIRLNIRQGDLPEHLQGFLGYVAQLRNSEESKERARGLIQSVRLVVGVELPCPVEATSDAFVFLVQLAAVFGGFVFVADSIMVPPADFVVGPMADDWEEEPDAEAAPVGEIDPDDCRHMADTAGADPTRVAMREEHYRTLAEHGFRCARWLPLCREAGGRSELRPVEEIAARALALNALFLWAGAPDEVATTERLERFVENNELQNWLTEEETGILEQPRDEARDEHGGNIGWKLENLWSLCWILGFEPPPSFFDGQISQDLIRAMIIDFLPDLDATHASFLEAVEPRSADEIDRMEDIFYCTHNAVRSAQCGSEDAVPAGFHPIRDGGAIHERRHSLTWAVSPGVPWEETDLST